MTEPVYLGKQSAIQTKDPYSVKLDLIPNPRFSTQYIARFVIPEFTSLCPQTGQPDFATIIIDYQPNKFLLESKALKLWMFAHRDDGAYHEDVTVGIAERFFEEVAPHWLRVIGFWYARGGISIDVVCEIGELVGNSKPLSADALKPYIGRHA